MRQFKLINADGVEFDLMRRDAFLHAPSGLGANFEREFSRAGYSFIQTDTHLAQKTISGEIVFSGYKQYQEFSSFAKGPLTLCYKPLNKWFYVDCHIDGLTKTEIFGSKLICPVDFICTSTWYESAVIRKTQLSGAGKRYNYSYPYTYAETSAGSIAISNTGSIPSPCRLHIMGPCSNPSWSLTQGGVVLQRGKVTAEIPAGNKIIVDSRSGHMELSKYTVLNEFVQNLYPSSDFSTARFILIPPGESTLAFTHEGIGTIDAFVEVNILAATV